MPDASVPSVPSILIVDGSSDARWLLADLALNLGIFPYCAPTAEKGFRIFLEHRKKGMIAVLTDGHLERCSGLELALGVRAVSPLPVLLISSDARFFVQEAPPGLFFRSFLKPCKMPALQAALEEILTARRGH